MFDDRADATRQLADRLAHLQGKHPLILAVPRGAVPMGVILARALGGGARLGAGAQARRARQPRVCRRSLGRGRSRQPQPRRAGLVDEAYVPAEVARQRGMLRRRRALYGAQRIDPAGRTLVVVDDGVATGAKLIAALDALRASRPARLIAAVAVAPPNAVARLVTTEAMKMVNLVAAPHAGTVKRLLVQAGDTVRAGDLLCELA